jgi:hypothetical protein
MGGEQETGTGGGLAPLEKVLAVGTTEALLGRMPNLLWSIWDALSMTVNGATGYDGSGITG